LANENVGGIWWLDTFQPLPPPPPPPPKGTFNKGVWALSTTPCLIRVYISLILPRNLSRHVLQHCQVHPIRYNTAFCIISKTHMKNKVFTRKYAWAK
jgi:hypothetical protein